MNSTKLQLHNQTRKTGHRAQTTKQFNPTSKVIGFQVSLVHQQDRVCFLFEHVVLSSTADNPQTKESQNQGTSFDSEHSRVAPTPQQEQ